MTVLSDLTAEIGAQLPTGVSHEITAAKLRLVLTDMVSRLSAQTGTSGGGAAAAEYYLTSNTTASSGAVYYCNTAAGGFTVTLPDAPTTGTGVGFRDAESSWSASNLTVFPGVNKIEGQTGNLVCDITNGNFDLVWSGGTDGWELIPVSAFASAGGGGGGGAGATYFHITSNGSVSAGGTYYADTAGGAFTVTLPTGPAIGDGISFRDASGTWGLSNLILNPGSNAINSNLSSLVVDQSDINFDLVWRGLPTGWQVEVPVSDAVRGSAAFNRLRAIQTLGALGQTLTGTSTGTPIVWNPSDKVANIGLSGGNLTATATASVAGGVRATAPGSAGRYFEVTWSTGTINGFGLATASQSLTTYPGNPNGIGFFASGYVEWPGSGTGNTTGTTWASGNVMGILLAAGSCSLYKNGALVYTVNTLPSGPLYPMLYLSTAGEAATANFGATTLGFLPSGATSWNGAQVGSGVASWNPADRSGVTLSAGNLTATGTGTGGGQVRGTKAGATGKYFELHIDNGGTSGSLYVGLANASQSLTSGYAGNPNGNAYFNNGYAEWVGGSGGAAGFTTGDRIGIRLLAGSAEFYLNGTLQFTSGGIPTGPIFPIVGLYGTTSAVTANFGASAFVSAPDGAVAWNS
jgi:hypothetical protein